MLRLRTRIMLFLGIIGLFTGPLLAQRVKDLARVQGIRYQHLKGIGLVTGLSGTGDSDRNRATRDLYATMLRHINFEVSADDLRSRNVALVLVTASVPSSTKVGSLFEVTVSSIGDAKSLKGGSLLETPLFGPGQLDGEDEIAYAIGHGTLDVVEETPTIGRSSAVLEEDISVQFVHDGTFTIILNRPDFSTANRIAMAIRDFPFLRASTPPDGKELAHAVDSGSVKVLIPPKFHPPERVIGFISRIMGEVYVNHVDREARVVIDRENSIVAVNGNVRVSPVVVQIDGVTIRIPPKSVGADPAVRFEPQPLLIDVMSALEQEGIDPKKMPAIIRSIDYAGALVGKLVER